MRTAQLGCESSTGAFSFQFYCALKFDMFALTILKTNFVEVFDLKVRFLKSIKVLFGEKQPFGFFL